MKLFRKKNPKRKPETIDEPEYPKAAGSCSGTEHAYCVEARHNFPEPKAIGDIILDKRWKRISFPKSHIGVPAGNALNHHSQYFGLMSYQAAQALRWWFLAECDAECLGSICVETRLVKHETKYNLECRAVSHHEHCGGDEGDYPNGYPPTELPIKEKADAR